MWTLIGAMIGSIVALDYKKCLRQVTRRRVALSNRRIYDRSPICSAGQLRKNLTRDRKVLQSLHRTNRLPVAL